MVWESDKDRNVINNNKKNIQNKKRNKADDKQVKRIIRFDEREMARDDWREAEDRSKTRNKQNRKRRKDKENGGEWGIKVILSNIHKKGKAKEKG